MGTARQLASALLPALLLALVLAVLSARGTGAIQYGGATLDDAQAATVLNKAATEISELLRNSAADAPDCGAMQEAVTIEDTTTPTGDAVRGFMDEATTSQWPDLVLDVQQAMTTCYTHWDCLGVALFSAAPPLTDSVTGSEIFIAKYMHRTSAFRTIRDLPGGELWKGSFLWRRTRGYACADDAVDPDWYRTAWQGRLALPTDIPLDAAGAREHFKTFGHMWRMWPNENCMLTPVLLSASTGCKALRCPTHTLCPEGYRTKHRYAHWCMDSGGSGAMAQVVADLGDYSSSYLAANNGVFDRAPCGHVDSVGTVTTGGICGYDLGIADVSDTSATCVCRSDVPEGDDDACELRASDYCGSPQTHITSNCAGAGACRFDINQVAWEDPELGMTPPSPTTGREDYAALLVPPPVSCVCDDPAILSGPWCDRSVCTTTEAGSGEQVDCHTAAVPPMSGETAPGTCVRQGAVFACQCNDLFFGPGCKWHEDFDLLDESLLGVDDADPEFNCFLRAADVGLTIPDRLWVECSGHGTCFVADPFAPLTSASCQCAPGYSGKYCHVTDCPPCGPLGKCVVLSPDESESGVWSTECVCAVHEDMAGLSLAAVHPSAGPDDPQCTIDMCMDVGHGRFGTLELTPGTILSAENGPPTGRCACVTLGNGLHNTGLLCDTPECEVDAEGNTCGIELDSISETVCRPCSDNPTLLACADTTLAMGAVCDCEDTGRDGGEASDPYWTSAVSIHRYIHEGEVGTDGRSVCSLYCNHGMWRSDGPGTEHACRGCFEEGWVGERCDEAVCLHGIYLEGGLCEYGSCFFGWTGLRCSKCDAEVGLGADGAEGCTKCLAGWAHPLGLDAGEIAALPLDETCVACDDPSVVWCYEPGTTIGGQACHHDDAPAKFTCSCKTGWTGDQCDRCAPGFVFNLPRGDGGVCTSLDTLLPCGAGVQSGATPRIVVVEEDGTLNTHASHCLCAANYDEASACATCVVGFGFQGGAQAAPGSPCVACPVAAGCFEAGTESVTCPVAAALAPGVRYTCHCRTEAGYTGDACNECDVHNGANWDTRAERCIKCGLACGANGVPNCDATPPFCMCMNGFSGTECDQCTGCGPGGLCVPEAFLTTPWCTCDTSNHWQKSLAEPDAGAGITADAVHMAPCDRCSLGYLVQDGTCKLVSQVCGVGAEVQASTNAQACFCSEVYLPLALQPSGKCDECVTGGVGPDCMPCDTPCGAHAVCAWVNTSFVAGPRCVCSEGYVDSALGACSQCDFPAYQGAHCDKCPEDCGKGAAKVEPATGSCYCDCPTGSHHTEPTNPDSPCTACPSGTTSLLCLPCPACGPNSHCVETSVGSEVHAVCECLLGYVRLPGRIRNGDKCFPASVVDLYTAEKEALPDLAYTRPEAPDIPAEMRALTPTSRVVVWLSTCMALVGPLALAWAITVVCRKSAVRHATARRARAAAEG